MNGLPCSFHGFFYATVEWLCFLTSKAKGEIKLASNMVVYYFYQR